jgi:hypothetical protein
LDLIRFYCIPEKHPQINQHTSTNGTALLSFLPVIAILPGEDKTIGQAEEHVFFCCKLKELDSVIARFSYRPDMSESSLASSCHK